MSDFDELMNAVPIDEIAGKLGISEEEARATVEHALPAVVQGLGIGVEDDDADAVADAVAAGDNEKVLEKAFGGKSDEVAEALGAKGVTPDIVSPDLLKKVMPILIPIVIAYLTKKGVGGGTGGGGILGQILGSILGGGSTTKPTLPAPKSSGGAGDIIGDILGSILRGR